MRLIVCFVLLESRALSYMAKASVCHQFTDIDGFGEFGEKYAIWRTGIDNHIAVLNSCWIHLIALRCR